VRPGHPATQGVELHLLQEGGQGVRVRIGHSQLFEGRGQGRPVVQPDQLAGQADLLGVLQEDLPALLLADLAGPGQEGLKVAVLVDQQGRGLDADARGAGHVVDGVAAKGLDLDHLVRRDAELLDHLLRPDPDVLHGVEHGHPRAHQLHQVLVGGNDGDLAARLADLAGIGGDQVVGLESRLLQGVDAEGAGGLAHQGELGNKVLGRRRAVGLVLGVDPVPEGLLGMVEDHRQMGRRVRLGLHVHQQLPQHVAEAGYGADRQTVRLAGEGRKGVEGPEDEAGAVDEVEAEGGVAHGPHPRGRRRAGRSSVGGSVAARDLVDPGRALAMAASRTNLRSQYGQSTVPSTPRSR